MSKRPPALILAGGKSSRMGRDKAFLELGGETILERILRRLKPQVSEISLNAPALLSDPKGLQLVPDIIPGQMGPLAGILSGLRDLEIRRSKASHLLVVPSDSPFFPENLAARLEAGVDHPHAIAVASSGGQAHPVFGLWPVALADDLQAWLSNPENRRIKAYLSRHRVVTVDFDPVETSRGPLDPFFNINTPEELAEARAFLEALA